MFAKTATECLELMARGDLSSVEIVRALHARADATESRVNALALQFREAALRRAEEADAARAAGNIWGPLHGLPITIKESLETEGSASTLGLVGRRRDIAQRDAVIVQLLKDAGAIVLAKTNIPQTLLVPMESSNPVYGTTHNPWRYGYGPGGSSGGEAAAIAAGSSIAGIGTDIGGSIRTPAAFCGIYGLKPTKYRWSTRGSRGVVPGQETVRAVVGPMARSAKDVALLFNAIDPLAQHRLDPNCPPLQASTDDFDVSKIKVGFYESDGFLTPAKSVQRAVRETATALENLGAHVRHFMPRNVEEIAYLYFSALSADGTQTVLDAMDGERFEPVLKNLARMARMPTLARRALARTLDVSREHRLAKLLRSLGEKPVSALWEMTARRDALVAAEVAAWDAADIDVLIAPVYATTAAPIGMTHDFTIGFVNVARYSLLNFPAGVIPVTRVTAGETQRPVREDKIDARAASIEARSVGLPVGVQIIARPWEEEKVLAVMRALEPVLCAKEGFPTTPIDPA